MELRISRGFPNKASRNGAKGTRNFLICVFTTILTSTIAFDFILCWNNAEREGFTGTDNFIVHGFLKFHQLDNSTKKFNLLATLHFVWEEREFTNTNIGKSDEWNRKLNWFRFPLDYYLDDASLQDVVLGRHANTTDKQTFPDDGWMNRFWLSRGICQNNLSKLSCLCLCVTFLCQLYRHFDILPIVWSRWTSTIRLVLKNPFKMRNASFPS